MENLLPYSVIVSQYAILTADVKEVQRSLVAEHHTLKRVLALLPYRLFPQLFPKEDSWRDHTYRKLRHALTMLRLSLPFG